MAEVAFLHYRPGNSLIHRLPGWGKLLSMLALSLLIGYAPKEILLLTCILLLLGSVTVKPPFLKMKGALLFAFMMAGLLVWSDFRQNKSEMEAFIRGSRFILIFWTGIIFTTCAHPAEIGEAFATLTRWIPFFPSEKLQTHITLTLTFLPLLLDESATVDRAARSRCFYRRKNPLLRLRFRVEPLIEGVFRKSDHISQAMSARCYGSEE
jgi:energy-coupling factor transporter transmembrane protein EcfT